MPAKPRQAWPHRPWALWLAVLIAVFGARAPTRSHALVLARGDVSPMQEVCTSTGPGWVALHIPAETSQDQESAPSLEHCPFCLLGADRAAPAPDALLDLFAVPGAFRLPANRQVFSGAMAFALTPPPRGPPPLIR
jgi:hypothetical protein